MRTTSPCGRQGGQKIFVCVQKREAKCEYLHMRRDRAGTLTRPSPLAKLLQSAVRTARSSLSARRTAWRPLWSARGLPARNAADLNFQRSLKPSAIRHNVKTAAQYPSGRALKKGGPHHPRFPAGRHPRHRRLCQLPMLHEGARSASPRPCTSQTPCRADATKMVADKVDRILVSFADSRSALPRPVPCYRGRYARCGRSSSSPAAPTPAALSALTRRRR